MTLGACKRCGEMVWAVLEAHPDGRPKRLGAMLETGTQVELMLSDGSEVSLSLCRSCADALTPGDYQPIWDAVVAAADPEHPGGAPLLRTKFPVALVRRRWSPEPGRMEIDRR